MPATDAQKRASKKWREKNKEKIAQKTKKYRKEHPELYKKASQKWRDNNPDKSKIANWKNDGMIDADWGSVYEMFIKENECWICGINFNETTRKKCLDHDHNTGELRYVCCQTCNVYIIG